MLLCLSHHLQSNVIQPRHRFITPVTTGLHSILFVGISFCMSNTRSAACTALDAGYLVSQRHFGLALELIHLWKLVSTHLCRQLHAFIMSTFYMDKLKLNIHKIIPLKNIAVTWCNSNIPKSYWNHWSCALNSCWFWYCFGIVGSFFFLDCSHSRWLLCIMPYSTPVCCCNLQGAWLQSF